MNGWVATYPRRIHVPQVTKTARRILPAGKLKKENMSSGCFMAPNETVNFIRYLTSEKRFSYLSLELQQSSLIGEGIKKRSLIYSILTPSENNDWGINLEQSVHALTWIMEEQIQIRETEEAAGELIWLFFVVCDNAVFWCDEKEFHIKRGREDLLVAKIMKHINWVKDINCRRWWISACCSNRSLPAGLKKNKLQEWVTPGASWEAKSISILWENHKKYFCKSVKHNPLLAERSGTHWGMLWGNCSGSIQRW